MCLFKVLKLISCSANSDKTRFYIDKSDIKPVRDCCGTYRSFSNKCKYKKSPSKALIMLVICTGPQAKYVGNNSLLNYVLLLSNFCINFIDFVCH